MTRIESEIEYKAVLERIEELLAIVGEETHIDDKDLIELDLLSGLVSDYENAHYPIAAPSLGAMIKLRMYEMNLTQRDVATILGINPSRVSELINEKSNPSLKTAREICQKLNIDPAIVSGL